MQLRRIKQYILRNKRYLWLWWQRKRLENGEVTIIANNCIGGIIYHDLGLRFLSPTINLDIPAECFLIFCEHLDEYLNLPIEAKECKETCPVGVIRGNFGDVQINFRHYTSFKEAVDKWNDRKARMRWNRIFIIMEDQRCDEHIAERFENLHYKNKVLFSALNTRSSVRMPKEFYGESYSWGKILEYPSNNIHRFLERLDYVSFLNGEGIKIREWNCQIG